MARGVPRGRPAEMAAVAGSGPIAHIERAAPAQDLVRLGPTSAPPGRSDAELGVVMQAADQHYDAVVIGSGFGGTLTALRLARAFKARGRGERILMLERGTWWTTPVGTVQDKEVKTYNFLRGKGQPVQYWSSAENFRGFIDLYTRCFRRKGNEDGLYDLTAFGRRGLFGLRENDGVSILRACGVGGGSLVYAKVTIRPPDAVLEDPRWPLSWTAQERDAYFDLARDAIGLGAVHALYQREVARDPAAAVPTPPKPVNTGLFASRRARRGWRRGG